MGSTADKASGLANEAIGKAKQGVGSVVGSEKLKAEGAAQELKGDAQKAGGAECKIAKAYFAHEAEGLRIFNSKNRGRCKCRLKVLPDACDKQA